jgi:hypothetical protein
VALLAVLSGFVVVSMTREGAIDPDAPVVVHTAEPLRVRIGVAASRETIRRALLDEIGVHVRSSTDETVRSYLTELSGDPERIDWMATTGVERFAAGRTAALAYPLYDVAVGVDAVTVVSITAELIPGYPGVAQSRDHEDGHAYINGELAMRCAASSVRRHAGGGAAGASLELLVLTDLQRLGEVAHEIYHSYVEGARLGQHMRHAEIAASQVTDDCA